MAITEKQQAFLEEVGALAVAGMRSDGILASLTLAQAILESDWGTSGLAVQGKALFGIKAGTSWKGKVYNAETQECYDGVHFITTNAAFRAYSSWADSVADHSSLLTSLSRYRAVVGELNYQAACQELQAAGYATDPHYAEKLIQLIEMYSLTTYDGLPAVSPMEEEESPEAAETTDDAETADDTEMTDDAEAADTADDTETTDDAEAAETTDDAETADDAEAADTTVSPQKANASPAKMRDSELIARLKDIVEHYKTLYVMGCFGAPLTGKNVAYYCSNHSYNRQKERTKMIQAAADQTPPVYGFDCVCLIKGILWGWTGDASKTFGGATYLSNDVPDIGADLMITKCLGVSTHFESIVPGEAVWMSGHIGIYIGGGMVIEASPAFDNRVQVTECRNLQKTPGLNGRKWTRHGRLPYVLYGTQTESVEMFRAASEEETETRSAPEPVMRPGARVKYSGYVYSKSNGAGRGKQVNGEFSVTYYQPDKTYGVHLEDLGWVPESACTVVA